MSIPLCTHIKSNGVPCGSPAVAGTELCYHHSTLKAALGNVVPLSQVAYGAFTPIPFVFPEDRASLQINYFLLLQAFNEQRIDLRTANMMQRIVRAMAANLGRSGSLVDKDAQQVTESASKQVSDQDSAHKAQENASESAANNAFSTEKVKKQAISNPDSGPADPNSSRPDNAAENEAASAPTLTPPDAESASQREAPEAEAREREAMARFHRIAAEIESRNQTQNHTQTHATAAQPPRP
ncbi:MAG: hypothetical protein ACRD22_21280 [Terriglobia bacterium]